MAPVLMRVPVHNAESGFLTVEVDDSTLEVDQVTLAAKQPAQAVITASTSLQESFDRVAGAVGEALTRFRSMPHAVDSIELEFGIKVGGEVGLIVARGTTDVNFQVRLSWQKPSG